MWIMWRAAKFPPLVITAVPGDCSPYWLHSCWICGPPAFKMALLRSPAWLKFISLLLMFIMASVFSFVKSPFITWIGNEQTSCLCFSCWNTWGQEALCLDCKVAISCAKAVLSALSWWNTTNRISFTADEVFVWQKLMVSSDMILEAVAGENLRFPVPMTGNAIDTPPSSSAFCRHFWTMPRKT